MKKFFALALSFLTATNANAQNAQESTTPEVAAPKILVAYYSWSGHTKQVAEAIHNNLGGDLFAIETVQAYPEEYRETTEQAKKEINAGYHPELSTKVADIAQYDVIFLGSPNWWGTIAPAVSSFLASYDLNGKTVIPFITHGSGGVQNTVSAIKEQCKGCNVSDNPWVGFRNRTFGLKGWLKDLGYIAK